MIERIALLFGMFVFPVWLLWLGHRLRGRTARVRGAFWGGVTGHTLAIIVAAAALQFPPVLWTGGVRQAVAFWAVGVGGLIGAAIGAARTSER